MITDDQVQQLRELGYEATPVYLVPEDPADPTSPRTKQVWAFGTLDATHYLAEEDQAAALIKEGAPGA